MAQEDHNATRKSGLSRKEGPDVWQFRWPEKDLHGVLVQRKRVIGTVERYPDGAAARTALTIVLAELNSGKARISCSSITVAQLCDHLVAARPALLNHIAGRDRLRDPKL